MIDLRYPINFEKDLSTRNFRAISGQKLAKVMFGLFIFHRVL